MFSFVPFVAVVVAHDPHSSTRLQAGVQCHEDNECGSNSCQCVLSGQSSTSHRVCCDADNTWRNRAGSACNTLGDNTDQCGTGGRCGYLYNERKGVCCPSREAHPTHRKYCSESTLHRSDSTLSNSGKGGLGQGCKDEHSCNDGLTCYVMSDGSLQCRSDNSSTGGKQRGDSCAHDMECNWRLSNPDVCRIKSGQWVCCDHSQTQCGSSIGTTLVRKKRNAETCTSDNECGTHGDCVSGTCHHHYHGARERTKHGDCNSSDDCKRDTEQCVNSSTDSSRKICCNNAETHQEGSSRYCFSPSKRTAGGSGGSYAVPIAVSVGVVAALLLIVAGVRYGKRPHKKNNASVERVHHTNQLVKPEQTQQVDHSVRSSRAATSSQTRRVDTNLRSSRVTTSSQTRRAPSSSRSQRAPVAK